MTLPIHDERCPRGFEERLLSGYLDQVLPQGERQRVRLHLETCESCRELLATLEGLRAAARSTEFQVPADEQWNEAPRTGGSRWSRGTGWLLVLLWAVAMAGIGILQLLSSGQPWWEKVVVFGGLAGGAFLLLSVLLDRLHDLETDRYRRVQK